MAILFGAARMAAASDAGLVLWNKLGSDLEITNSAFGPNLQKYTGGSWPDVAANAAYAPGVFGNSLTIGSGSYSTYSRVHNVVFNNLNQYINTDRGTIDVWFKQNSSPVANVDGIHRIFDGGFGFGSGINLDVETGAYNLGFGLTFGASGTAVNYDISAFNGTWINLAGVWDRAGLDGTADKLRLYVNGQLVASSTNAAWGNTCGSQADIAGGQDSGCAGQFFVDNLKVYNRALSASEVQQVYTGGEAPGPTPPAITSQPVNQTFYVGQTATFNVAANGSSPLQYQWRFNGTNLSNATNATLTLTNVQLSQAGNYSVLVTNLYGSVPSSNALLVVNVPGTQTTNGLVLWNKLGSITEVTNSAFGPNLQKYTGGSWPDVAANAAFAPGVYGNSLTIGSGSYPTYSRVHNVVFNNLNQYINTDRGTIDVWFKQNASPVANVDGIHRIFDGGFGFGSGINLDVETGAYNLGFGLTFGASGTAVNYDISSLNGTWINLAGVWDRAGLDGTADKLRLYVNGRLVASSTTAAWGSTCGTRADIGGGQDTGCAGQFYVDNLKVYNRGLSAGEVQQVYTGGGTPGPTAPAITQQPQSQLVESGDNVTLSVQATGSPLYYQWLVNGANLPGATASSLNFNPVDVTNAGIYSVIVSNAAGVAVSSNATLRVNRAPVADAGATVLVDISPNGTNALVVLDGSRSSDPDGDALTCAWFLPGVPNPLATGVVAFATLPVGTNQLTLTVNDGLASNSQTIFVQVITTSQAVDWLIQLVRTGPGNATPLVASLRAALAAIDRSQPQTAINQLQAFINKVNAELAPSDPVLAAQLVADAQDIITALNGGTPLASAKVAIASLKPGQNGKLHLKINGIYGRVHVIETSTDMVNWVPVGVASQSDDGSYQFDAAQPSGSGTHFYRVISPK